MGIPGRHKAFVECTRVRVRLEEAQRVLADLAGLLDEIALLLTSVRRVLMDEADETGSQKIEGKR